jgi:hypothetical protein
MFPDQVQRLVVLAALVGCWVAHRHLRTRAAR